MELLGENLAELRRVQQGRFSMTTTLKLGIQMIKGIESVHDFGYLHRDIKPSNFAMGIAQAKKQTCFIIDFGLARRYMLPDGEIRPPRDCAGFRGTARYASIHSHQSRDLGRRDDLWSVLYLLIEFAQGQLPWRRLRDKDKVGEMKVKCNNDDLVAGLPPEFLQFMKHLMSLHYHSRPDYTFLINMFEDLYKRIGGTDKTPFDWELPTPPGIRRSRPLPSLVDLSFVAVVAGVDLKEVDPALIARIPSKTKKRIFEFLIRLKENTPDRALTERLLDKSVQSLDLTHARLTAEDMIDISEVSSLRILKLGEISDDVLKELVERRHDLEELEMKGTRNLTEKGLKFIASNCGRLRCLSIRDSDKIPDKAVEGLLKTCENLSQLSLRNCKKVKGTALKPFTGEKGALRSKKPLPPRLVWIDFSGCPLGKSGLKKLQKIGSHLDTLLLNPLVGVSKGAELAALIKACVNLRRLEIGSETGGEALEEAFSEVSQVCRDLEHLHIGGRQLTEQVVVDILTQCSRLKDVSISQEMDNGFAATTLPRTLRLCSSLDRVKVRFGRPLYKPTTISDTALKSFLHSSMNVTELSLIECLILGAPCFPESFPNLRVLDLSDCIQLQDSVIQKISESAPFLRTLRLNRLNNITKVSLEAISQHCRLLEECELKGCVCFPDDELKFFMKKLPLMFLTVTRYTKRDTVGIEKEVHYSNADDVFQHYPNLHRDYVFMNLIHPLSP
mmetsp:Transcript_14316/g.19863  ORF Transcript_14316/g.19863 Transcript_14316/m.19863 type:complete len:729 (-) Transcript_14316:56-2242(-)